MGLVGLGAIGLAGHLDELVGDLAFAHEERDGGVAVAGTEHELGQRHAPIGTLEDLVDDVAAVGEAPGDELEAVAGAGIPGARDGFELVTRGLTDGRYIVDEVLERPDRGVTLAQFVFRPRYGDTAITLLVREGQVTDEFVEMARKPDRTEADEAHFTALKQGMADRLMASAPEDIFEVEAG